MVGVWTPYRCPRDDGNDSRNTGGQPRTARRRYDSQSRITHPIPDVCAALGKVSRTTVYGLVSQRELIKVSIGRRSFITTESLVAYVERLAAAAGIEATGEDAALSNENDEAALA